MDPRQPEGDTMAFNRLVLRWETPIFNLALRSCRIRTRPRT